MRAGFTLIELIVALAIMSVSFAVVAIGISESLLADADPRDWTTQVAAARRQAVATGQLVVLDDSASTGHTVLFLPDGRAVGARVEPLTGLRRGTR